jgi:hypothetical protein
MFYLLWTLGLLPGPQLPDFVSCSLLTTLHGRHRQRETCTVSEHDVWNLSSWWTLITLWYSDQWLYQLSPSDKNNLPSHVIAWRDPRRAHLGVPLCPFCHSGIWDSRRTASDVNTGTPTDMDMTNNFIPCEFNDIVPNVSSLDSV